MTPTAEFAYRSHRIRLELLDECSVSSHLAGTGTFYEQDFLEHVSTMLPAGTLVLDVGAHIGNHTVYFAQVMGFRVIAFEPNPRTYERLVRNVELAGVEHLVTCHNVALSDHEGEAELFLGARADLGTATIEGSEHDPDDAVAVVRTSTLDRYMDALAEDTDAIFVKLDVEGHEASVLAGAAGLLARPSVRTVSTECIDVESFEQCRSWLEPRFRPISLLNPTPTVVFDRVDGGLASDESGESIAGVVRYGIAAASAANRASASAHSLSTKLEHAIDSRDRAVGQRDDADATAKWATLLLQAMVTRAKLSGTPDDVGAAYAAARLRWSRPEPNGLARVVLIELGGRGTSPEVLSALFDRVDLVHIAWHGPECDITHRSYAAGNPSADTVAHHRQIDASLVAANVSAMLCSELELDPASSVCVVGGPERYPVLAESIVGALACPYVMSFDEPRYNGSLLRLENGALACFVGDEKAMQAWGLQHIIRAEILPKGAADRVADRLQHLATRSSSATVRLRQTNEQPHRVLIVSYFAFPTTPVSTQRLGYWHEHLGELARERGVEIEVTWLSATARAEELPGNRVVRDRGDRLVAPSIRDQIVEMERLGLPTIGVSWAHNVRNEVRGWDESYDTVVISGGPFGYFDLGDFFKESWDCRVLLDFRDPYGGDPRMQYRLDQRAWLIAHERRAVESADAIVSVNQRCLDSISADIPGVRAVVSNGYDERIVDPARATAADTADGMLPIRLVYSGTVYANWGMEALLDALSPARHRLVHLGRDQSPTRSIEHHVAGESRGFVEDKAEMARLLCSSHAGIVRIGGEATVETTKVFDYVGCDLDVIIVTDGQVQSGALHELTKDLSGVFWVRNEPTALETFFAHYEPSSVSRPERERFSRRFQASRLLDLILEESHTERRASS